MTATIYLAIGQVIENLSRQNAEKTSSILT